MSNYRVYFLHPSLQESHKDIAAENHKAAEAAIASPYALATHIKAVPLCNIFPDFA